jgi:hypothetical protein
MKKTILFLCTAVLLASCGDDSVRPCPFKHIEKLDIDNGIINYHTYMEGDAHSGKKFSRAAAGEPSFGFGYIYQLPDTLKGETVIVDIDSWVRTGDLANNCEMIVSVKAGDSLLIWQGLGIKNAIKNANEWTNAKGFVLIPPTMTNLGQMTISVLAHNVDGKSFFDVDDCQISISQQASEE